MIYNEILAAFLILTTGIIMISLFVGWVRKRRLQREREERWRKKGEEGEISTAVFLSKVRGFKRLLHHVYVPTADGVGTTEIDLVMIHEKGIIVIENKNYKGYIYGDEDDLYWTQVFGKRGKRSFYNPVKQNQGHIRHLKNLLEGRVTEAVPYLSVVTFNKGGRLKKIRVNADTATVISSKKVRRRLKKRLRRMPRVLNRNQVDEIYGFLQGETGETKKNRKKHIKQVRRLNV